jgi:membrane protein implicated in regulation of membrane protease activity
MGGAQVFTMLGGMLISAGAVVALAVAPRFGVWAQVALIVIFSAVLVLATLWARWRVSRGADAFEIRADEVRM